jgi:uncharacterized protein
MPKADASAPSKSCPICGKPPAARVQPFCSRRCADVDLHRWLAGAYVIPTAETPEDEAQRPSESDREAD